MTKKIAILTSGGDAPGMNSAIRSIVVSAISRKIEVFGFLNGYLGLSKGYIRKLNMKSVSDVIQRGGTFLGSSRFKEFQDEKIRKEGINIIKKYGIEGLIVIGGEGSYKGAKKLNDMGCPCIAIPGTIDNDINNTDYTIGYSTALNTVVKAIDHLRDTSCSHQRISIIEVMGRKCGELALSAAIAGGCDFVVIPEITFKSENLVSEIKHRINKKKIDSMVVVITEKLCDTYELSRLIENHTKKETRTTILGHIQRGGIPVPYDRILGSRMGMYAVELLVKGKNGVCIGIKNDVLMNYSITDATSASRCFLKKDLFNYIQNYSRIFK